ncbi:MAG: NAD(P)(+) transhydrogenase (Re/Si-specific) subunit beta [Candidatus Eisenbacteria bacterium]|nr:NAD(P)(+) transhydrogenase (Re/Si-specific) subunit beta [Candidatus Eisenbacteria bacterium]
MSGSLINLAYLIAAVLFILGLKGLAHPRTAVRGNLLGALGMLLAIVVTLLDRQIIDFRLILAGLVIGGGVGAVLAQRVPMTAMPQFVALFNGFGGIASVLVAGAAHASAVHAGLAMNGQFTVSTAATALIGAVTFWGSMVAFAKLQGLMTEKPVVFPGQFLFNILLFAICLALSAYLVMSPRQTATYWALSGVASLLGVLLILPIGGADMPVVIALLNSYSGLAGAATGFVLSNEVLIISGALVGASGIILSQIMCRAMNRSLTNVLFGRFSASAAAPAGESIYAGKVKSVSADEVAMILEGARRVVFVPGYGLAVAQAQHAVRDLGNLLERRGAKVEYAIHPVAGRMPGHMNVLLAEADVPYDKLVELDAINPQMEQVDVAIVIGANDVVNPSARDDPKSPIAGMPIIEVDKARAVIVIKRSLSPGFAGIPNPLFAADNTLMYFADGKKAILDLLAAWNK